MASRPHTEPGSSGEGPSVFVFGGRAEDARLFERTARSLRGLGAVPTDLTRASPAGCASALAAAPGCVWLLRAGSWLRGPIPSLPAPSATGRPLCAVGRILHGDPNEVRAWDEAHASTGGDLSTLGSPPPLASVVLEPHATAALAALLEGGLGMTEALVRVVTSRAHRAVRVHGLDVHDDPGLRATLVITSLQQGGAERIALTLASGLLAASVATQLVALGRTSRRSLAVPSSVTLRIPRAPLRADRLRELGRLAVDFGTDVLSTHLLTTDDLRALAEHRIPTAVTVHNARIAWPAGLETLAREQASLLIACAQSVESDVRAALAEREDRVQVPHVRTVWNGVKTVAGRGTDVRESTRRALEVPADAVLLLAVANPRSQKRLELLPGVAAATEERLSRPVHVVVAGAPGSDADSLAADAALRAAIRSAGREHGVRLVGSADDVNALYAAADVLVSPSAWEGLSLAHLEALAAGLPVVATAVGGAEEVAARAPRMTLVAPDATAQTFAAAIAEQLARHDAAALPADFSAARMVERHAALLRRVASFAAKPGAPDAGVYFVMNNVSVGGAQSSARRLALGLHAEGMRVRFAVLQEREDNPTPGLQALRAAGIPVFVPEPSRDPAVTVQRILRDLDAEPTRAVLFWNAIAEHQVLFADACLDVPMIEVSPGEMLFSSMEAYFERPRPGLPYRRGTDLGRRLAATVVKYRAEATRAARFFGAPVHVIPNGVPLLEKPAPRAFRGGPLMLGTAARISPQKKLGDLLDALRLCHARMPPYVLRIAGAPERGAHQHAEELRARAEGLPVEWVGERSPVRPFLSELDLFVMISEPAGCPNASIEAMAAGLPVVATAVGGAIDQIAHGETGLLTPPADAQALADALLLATGDRARLAAWGEAGRRRAEELFDVARMVNDYRRLIDLVGAPRT